MSTDTRAARSAGPDRLQGLLLFGEDCRLDVVNATLQRGASPVALTPKAFSVLVYLVTLAGRLVTKDEFMDHVWPGVFVGDAALKVCVREIRRALGDQPDAPRFIETSHRGVIVSSLGCASNRTPRRMPRCSRRQRPR